MTDVYISYVREDRKRVRPLVRFLRNEGLDVWWDESPPADGKWTPAVRRALVESAAIVVFWSEQSAASSWIAAEANHAHDRRALVPIMLEDCKPPAPFDKIISADLIKWKGQTDDEEFEDVVRKVKELVAAWKATSSAPPPAPEPLVARAPQQQAQSQPQRQAAQAAPAGGGFFSASLGGPAPQPTTARATPSPQTPLQPAPQPAQPQSFNPPPQRPAPPPRAVTPVNEAPRPPQAPPPRAITPVNEAPRPPQAPPPRLVTPIDEAPARPAPPAAAAPLPRAVRREPPPPREIVQPVDEAPRRSGGMATVIAGAIVAGGLVAAGVIWGLPLLNQGGEVQQAVDVAPLPVPDETASVAEDELNGPIPEDAPIEEAPLAPPEATASPPPAAPPQTRPPAQTQQAQVRPPAQPRTQQTAALAPPTQLNLSGVGAATDAPPAATDTLGDLERCLGRLVRLCDGLQGGRAGFATDGTISGAERTLLNQRSLFGWSDVTPGNVANCQRHLNSASGRAGNYDPLVSACRAFPVTNAAGPDR